MAGYAVGALSGFLVPHLHKINDNEKVSLIPSPAGLSLIINLKKSTATDYFNAHRDELIAFQ